MERKEMLDRKYANLLLKRCISFNNTDTLLIEYQTHEHDDFVKIIIEEAKKMGIKNIETTIADKDEIHEYLKNTTLEDININPLFDRSSWDRVAKKDGCILHILTYIPNLLDDIEQEKIDKMNKIMRSTNEYYRNNTKRYTFPWNIFAYPNKRWADFLFDKNEDSYSKLYNYIIQMCMVDRDDPIKAWQEFIDKNNYYKNRLNELNIEKLHYKNNLGTDLEIGFMKNYQWINLDKTDKYGSPIICNMPSYEIFTSPDSRTANGIVYNSKPLIYDDKLIDNFYIEFKDGIAVNYKAKVGNDVLKSIIEEFENLNKIGEVALVDYNSPISNTNIVFYNTLFDENASCHIALGNGFQKSIIGYENMTDEELEKLGLNKGNGHVDFMIGTEDLEINAKTKKGKVNIFKNGNFNI